MITNNRNKNMCVSTILPLMIDGSNMQLRFQRSKGIFQFGQHGVNFPDLFFTEIISIGAQVIAAGEFLVTFILDILPGNFGGRTIFLFNTNVVKLGNFATFLF